MDLQYVHFYRDDSVSNLDTQFIAAEFSKIFQKCNIDIRKPFDAYWKVAQFQELCEVAKISETRQPFERQPKAAEPGMALYDGFELQRLFCSIISDEELNLEHIHVVLTQKLTCTFDEEDWRYHARAVICGSPSIISSSGIVEAPARPREYYYMARPGLVDREQLRKEFAGRFIEYTDTRLSSAILLYLVQATCFPIANGEPFCDNQSCLLFNAHWQEELIGILQNPAFCDEHEKMIKKFNAKSR